MTGTIENRRPESAGVMVQTLGLAQPPRPSKSAVER